MKKNAKIVIVDYGVGNLRSLIRAFEHFGVDVAISEEANKISLADALVLPGDGAFAAGMEGLKVRGLTKAVFDFANGSKPLLGICLGAQILMSVGYEFGKYRGLDLISGKVVKFNRYPRPKGRGSLIFAQDSLPGPQSEGRGPHAIALITRRGTVYPRDVLQRRIRLWRKSRGFFAQNKNIGEKIPQIGWNNIYPAWEKDWKGTILEGVKPQSNVYFIHSYILVPRDKNAVLALTNYGSSEFCSVVRKGQIWGCQFHPEKSGQVGLKIIGNFIKMVNAKG